MLPVIPALHLADVLESERLTLEFATNGHLL